MDIGEKSDGEMTVGKRVSSGLRGKEKKRTKQQIIE